MDWLEPDLRVNTRAFYEILTSALPWASADTTRPHLNCAYFNQTRDADDQIRLQVVTTNGHGLFLGTVAARVIACRWSVLATDLETIRKALRPHATRKAPETHVRLAHGWLSVCRGPIADDPGPILVSLPFPHWDRESDGLAWQAVTRFDAAPKPEAYVTLNPSYVAMACKSLSAGESGVQISTQADDTTTVRFDGYCTSDLDPAYVLVMPMRGEARRAPSATLDAQAEQAEQAKADGKPRHLRAL